MYVYFCDLEVKNGNNDMEEGLVKESIYTFHRDNRREEEENQKPIPIKEISFPYPDPKEINSM